MSYTKKKKKWKRRSQGNRFRSLGGGKTGDNLGYLRVNLSRIDFTPAIWNEIGDILNPLGETLVKLVICGGLAP